jgi:spermidine synthase
LTAGSTASWRVAVLAALFLSGAAALIAQVCWIRRAGLAFGSTVEALSTVLAVFFLGLAVGAYGFGERARHIERPLRAYALVEGALAVLVLATPALFDVADALYGSVYRAADGPSSVLYVARVGLVGLVLFVPTVLMGGTLPLICRQLIDSQEHLGQRVGTLYGLNTLGGAVGAACCGFVLLPAFGMWRTLLLAAALDLAAALLAAAAGWSRAAPAASTPSPPRGRRAAVAAAGGAGAIVAAIFFCTGAVALGNEVLWTRFLALVVRTTVITYPLCLTIVLIGIVLGSWCAALIVDRGLPRARLLGALQVGGGLVVLVLLLLPPAFWRALEGLWTYALLLLPAAVLSGATFPLVVRMVVDDPALAAAGVGRLTAINTIGGIAGSLLLGFVALPRLGLMESLYLTSGLAVASGGAAWWFLDRRAGAIARGLAVSASVVAWAMLPRLLGTRLPEDFLADPAQLIAMREGRESNLAVVRRDRRVVLEADRWWQGQDRKTHQVLAAHVPLLLHAAPRRVLVVGVGAGQTPASMLLHDLERLDAVDIEPAVFDLVRAHFASAWMADPRLRLITEDGHSYVSHAGTQYDVIALELGQVFRPGVASFYSLDFYRRVRARLAPDGIVSQFVPLPFLSVESFARIVATFLEVFPNSVLWYNTAELLLIGTVGDHLELAVDRLQLLSSNPNLNADLRYSPWGGQAYWLNQPSVFLGGFLLGSRGLRALAAGAPIETDDRPGLAYATRAASELEAGEVAIADRIRAQLEPFAGVLRGTLPAATLAAAAQVRERNLTDIAASALLRRVDALVASRQYDALSALLDAAQRLNPDNVQAPRLAGDLALFRAQLATAQAAYGRTLELDPSDAEAHLGLARALQLQGRGAVAIEHYRVWLAAHPDDAEVHNALAGALAERGDLAGAEEQLQIAVRLRPDWTDAATNLARVRAARARLP